MSLQIRPSHPERVFLADFLRPAPVLFFAGFLFTGFLFTGFLFAAFFFIGFLPVVFFFPALISENSLSPGDIARPIDHNDRISSRSNLTGLKCSVSSQAL
jgi:hypothetical protein